MAQLPFKLNSCYSNSFFSSRMAPRLVKQRRALVETNSAKE